MVPEGTQEGTGCLAEAQSESEVTQLDDTVTMASTNDQDENESGRDTPVTVRPEILTASDCQERVQSPEEAHVSDIMMPQAPDEDVSTELPSNVVESLSSEENSRTSHDPVTNLEQEVPELFTYPASTVDIQGSAAARSDQGAAQVTCSLPNSSASSEVFQENGESTLDASANASLPNNPMGQDPLRHLFSNPFDYELEKLRIQEENENKNFEETTSELKAELERKMAEVKSEYEKESQELEAAYKAAEMERGAYKSSVEMGMILSDAFKFKCAEPKPSTSTDAEALREIISQYRALQREEAQRMNSTARPRRSSQPRPISQEVIDLDADEDPPAPPPRPSVTPNPPVPLSPFLRCTTAQTTPITQRAPVQANTHISSTAPPPPQPSVTAVAEAPPISQQALVKENTPLSSTAPPRRPSVTSKAISLHSPRSNAMPQPPRPPPVISNLTRSSSTAASSPPVHVTVRGPAPHLKRPRRLM